MTVIVLIVIVDTKVIFLSGNLPEDQWDDLTLGIRHLLKDLLQISDVAIETTITYPNEYVNLCKYISGYTGIIT